MNLTEFLTLLVPPPGTLVAGQLVSKANGVTHQVFQHTIAKSHGQLAAYLQQMDIKGNAYFALASYKQGFHAGPVDPKTGKAHQQLRVRTNVEALKALWFDIDFKPKKDGTPPKYKDIASAARALRAFCDATGIPTPAILVASGNGLHVYWPLTTSVLLDQWQRLADALKAAALEHGLDIDAGCTADACRVLRPIGTYNKKDPANPKRVELRYADGRTFDYVALETALTPWLKARTYTQLVRNDYAELTGGLAPKAHPPSSFGTIVKHCGVAHMLVETHGAKCSEPLWKDSLQLLRHCEDGEMWVHPISDGHPTYSPAETDKKWAQRSTNVGPTLCSTFEQHEPAICAKCPRHGLIATPLHVGYDDVQSVGELPNGWRIAENRKGIERLYIDPMNGNREWQKVLSYTISNLHIDKSLITGKKELTFDFGIGKVELGTITMAAAALGNPREISMHTASFGLALSSSELKFFGELMTTWLKQLQAARHVAEAPDRLGWLDGDEVGFSCGPSIFYADGRTRNGVRAPANFAQIAKYYEPKGELSVWQSVAGFLTTQNNAALTAILSAAFAAPLLRFTGHSGAILSFVSTASGVGKSSGLKCSQAVWGSPTHGVNAVDDTINSVANKLGYLRNLPVYWDELRGQTGLDAFLTLAFQITQGKEKSRLDSSAQSREVNTWQTLLTVASNESIFEAASRRANGSDAGHLRVYEIMIDQFTSAFNRADVAMMFSKLDYNYGHAGRIYAQWLATHHDEAKLQVEKAYRTLTAQSGGADAERFWIAIMAVLIVGAMLANKLGLTNINLTTLTTFLRGNLVQLRLRGQTTMDHTQPRELLAAFMADHQDGALLVDSYPVGHGQAYVPIFRSNTPRRVTYHTAVLEQKMRIRTEELRSWLSQKRLPLHSTFRRIMDELAPREIRTKLGAGTALEIAISKVLEFDLAKLDIPIVVGLSNPGDNSGSHAPTAPAGSTPSSTRPP